MRRTEEKYACGATDTKLNAAQHHNDAGSKSPD